MCLGKPIHKQVINHFLKEQPAAPIVFSACLPELKNGGQWLPVIPFPNQI